MILELSSTEHPWNHHQTVECEKLKSSWKSNIGNIWDLLSSRSKITLPSRCFLFESDRNCWARVLGTTRGCVKFTYVSQPWLLREWQIFSFNFSMILLVHHQMIFSIAMDKRLETWHSLWEMREGRLKNVSPVHFPKYDRDIALFLGQDISQKLSPKQPPETALPENAVQDTSLFLCGSLSRTSGTCLSQSYSVWHSNCVRCS